MAAHAFQTFGCFFFFFFVIILVFSQSLFHVGSTRSVVGSEDFEWMDEKEDDVNMVQTGETSKRVCDLSVGKWIYDQSYPLYDANCPYLSSKVNCQRNGRPDSDYEKWRWKPLGCNIRRYDYFHTNDAYIQDPASVVTLPAPATVLYWSVLQKLSGPTMMFDALDFLAKMRKKRLMLVGDSIMRNQWESLVCLIESVIPPQSKTVYYDGPSMAFHASDFEASIEFSWAPFLVELKVGSSNKRILELDSIEENARYWRGVDILVFDSAHWWTHSAEWSSWDYYMEGKRLFTNLNPMIAYEKGLITWAKWVDLNLDPQRTRVIFRSVSPRHNRQNGLKCYNQKEPLGYFKHPPHLPEQLSILQRVLKMMRFPVHLQDITLMSALRKDGHPSVYAKGVDEEERAHPGEHSLDCSHWCLPGVPDTWNEMLYALI